jgi:ABC-type Fe3+ transport system permease subunit
MKMRRSLVFLPALPFAVPAIAAADGLVIKFRGAQ